MADKPTVTDLLAAVRNELRVTRTIPSTGIVLRQRAVDQAVEYILSDTRFDDVQVSLDNMTTIAAALSEVTLDGMIAEFGVYKGTSLTQIAKSSLTARCTVRQFHRPPVPAAGRRRRRVPARSTSERSPRSVGERRVPCRLGSTHHRPVLRSRGDSGSFAVLAISVRRPLQAHETGTKFLTPASGGGVQDNHHPSITLDATMAAHMPPIKCFRSSVRNTQPPSQVSACSHYCVCLSKAMGTPSGAEQPAGAKCNSALSNGHDCSTRAQQHHLASQGTVCLQRPLHIN